MTVLYGYIWYSYLSIFACCVELYITSCVMLLPNFFFKKNRGKITMHTRKVGVFLQGQSCPKKAKLTPLLPDNRVGVNWSFVFTKQG